MLEDNGNRLYSDDLLTGRRVPTSQELELATLRFSVSIRRLHEKLNIESGAGRLILQHIFESSGAASEMIQKATTQRNKAKAQKLYAGVLQQVQKIVHWLTQLEYNGEITFETMVPLRDAGNALSTDLKAFCAPQPARPGASLGEKALTDI